MKVHQVPVGLPVEVFQQETIHHPRHPGLFDHGDGQSLARGGDQRSLFLMVVAIDRLEIPDGLPSVDLSWCLDPLLRTLAFVSTYRLDGVLRLVVTANRDRQRQVDQKPRKGFCP